ncbi:MAG: cytidylate kinase-like family protein [Candidatus Eremiobacteraeota bacterium]|nr:cytidylate kinase-like family protein [Candidatus Eremiobacteraeota bacterium]
MIVTISREYGAAAIDVAHRVGELLGYRVAGEDFPSVAALRLGMTSDDVVAVEHRAPSLAERILHNLGTALPESHSTLAPQSFDDEVRKEIEAAVCEAAEQPDVVIIGGMANAILRGRPNVLSVFLHAPLAFRIERIKASHNFTDAEARKEVARVDAARKRWAKLNYDVEWGFAGPYDLTLDVSRFGIEGTARIIADAASRCS